MEVEGCGWQHLFGSPPNLGPCGVLRPMILLFRECVEKEMNPVGLSQQTADQQAKLCVPVLTLSEMVFEGSHN